MDKKSIPTIAEAAAHFEFDPESAHTKRFVAPSANQNPMVELHYALAKDGAQAANRVMEKYGWTALSTPCPSEENWHKEASLIFYACWDNDGFMFNRAFYLKLYDYLLQKDPDCIFSRTPKSETSYPGGTMLHATLHGNPNPILVKDLLDRGVNPLDKDLHGKSYIDYLKQRVATWRVQGKLDGANEKTIHYVEALETLLALAQEKAFQRTHSAAHHVEWTARLKSDIVPLSLKLS